MIPITDWRNAMSQFRLIVVAIAGFLAITSTIVIAIVAE